MPETFEAQLSELATRASNIATLDEAAHLRRRADRRTWRHRGQAAVGVAAAAAVVGAGLTVNWAGAASPVVGVRTNPSALASSQAALAPTSTQPTPTASTTPTTPDPLASALAAAEAPHDFQIQAQLQGANHTPLGDSAWAVISKSTYDSIYVTFYATAGSHTEVTGFGGTWAQVIAAMLESGFPHVSIKAEVDKSVLADSVLDVRTTAGVSVVGQRIRMSTTPIVVIAAVGGSQEIG